MAEKLKRILKDRSGVSFPLIIAVTLALTIILCGVSEYFRLNIIAAGVKEATEDAIISAVNDNYANVYHGVREGYSGGYMPVRFGGRILPSMHITLKVQAGYIQVF